MDKQTMDEQVVEQSWINRFNKEEDMDNWNGIKDFAEIVLGFIVYGAVCMLVMLAVYVAYLTALYN